MNSSISASVSFILIILIWILGMFFPDLSRDSMKSLMFFVTLSKDAFLLSFSKVSFLQPSILIYIESRREALIILSAILRDSFEPFVMAIIFFIPLVRVY